MASLGNRFRKSVRSLFLTESGKGKISTVRGFFSSYNNNYSLKKGYDTYEKIYKEVPLVQAAINYTSDLAVGVGYELLGEDERKIKTVTEFFESQDFHMIALRLARNMLIYGNGYLELVRAGSRIVELKILHPKTMSVTLSEDGTGEIIGYEQKSSHTQSIDFTTDEIAHFKMNVIGDAAEGTSAIECVRTALATKLQMEHDLRLISHRYAAPQVHYKLGTETEPATESQIDDFESQLSDQNPEMDLITAHNVGADVLRPLGSKIGVEDFLSHMENQVIAGLQVPEVALGRGQSITEATAKVQIGIFDRRVKSIQEVLTTQINMLIIDKIVTPGSVKLKFGEFSKEDEDVKVNRLLRLKAAGIIDARYVAQQLGIKVKFIPKEDPGNPGNKALKGLDDNKKDKSPHKAPLKEGFYYFDQSGKPERISAKDEQWFRDYYRKGITPW